MNERLLALFARVDPRLLLPAMIFIIGLIAFEGWYAVLRKPLGEYQRLKTTRTALAATLESAAGGPAELNRLQTELKQLSDRMDGELRLPTSDVETAALLMTELDRSAARHGVVLTGVKPGRRKQITGVEEIAFDVGAQGSYLPLCRWLIDLKPALGLSATVTDFEMKSIDEGRKVALALKLALYRPLQSPGAGR